MPRAWNKRDNLLITFCFNVIYWLNTNFNFVWSDNYWLTVVDPNGEHSDCPNDKKTWDILDYGKTNFKS